MTGRRVTWWIAVLFAAVFGPDLVSTSGTNATRVPSVFVVAPFAYFGTRAVASYGRAAPA